MTRSQTAGRRRSGRARGAALLVLVTAAAVLTSVAPVTSAAPAAPAAPAVDLRGTDADAAPLRLVTLAGPGLAGTAPERRAGAAARLRAAQDRTLRGLGAPEPVYRWSTALNGYAVRLDADQAARLGARPSVVSVEDDAVRPLAADDRPPAPGSPSTARRGGAGVVVGVVDSGVDPDARVLADGGVGPGGRAADFTGPCAAGAGWGTDTCGDKLVGARWFVAGFGRDRLASSATLSARDDAGHGTGVASIAAGNADVTVGDRGDLGTYAGVAPQARVAAYKACWTAPDPADDGCATSDLVSAVDLATADGVDVLSVAVGGPSRLDTLDRALLGAAEADVVVVTAAGNDAASSWAAHAAPWALTVGAHTTPVRRGRLVLPGGPTLSGAMAVRRTLDDVPLVAGSRVAAPGARRTDARLCRPGSLDAARAAGAVVVCDRGRVSRLEKSAEVDRAGGVAMVLANRRGAALSLDLHRVPVLHLAAAEADRLRAVLRERPRPRARLEPDRADGVAPRPAGFSATGDPAAGVVAPTLLGPGTGVLGAVPPGPEGPGWRSFTGTSAATAVLAGAAARVRAARPGWTADEVRSALTTTALPLDGSPGALREGAGRVRAGRATSPGLVYPLPAAELRRYLDGARPPVATNTASVLLRGGPAQVTRRVRNVTGTALYFSSAAEGFRRHAVSVRPAALRLAPGETASFTVRVSAAYVGGGAGRAAVDSGTVTWRGADGSRVRIPVVVSR